ncbi:hypothetical protein BFJ63_vAg19714 [Fusarium oxysporum f. sp. narcissi]|uniref:Uncharacterized protein n=1 Tax=Fusarium oxysporum f. sp. narcissi TaxID=451672 RepID=A0A4Q2UU17_FUSOX|nr:hypothetical protein BFJ63_vAg19714 [Fusarium oxysporum f. sp. narcissi]
MYAHRHAHEKGSSQEEVPSWEGGKSLRGLMGGSSSDDDAIGHWADDRGQARGRRNRDEKGLIEIYGRGLGSMVAEHSRANKLASPRLGSASSSSSSLKAIPVQDENVSGLSLHTRRSRHHAQSASEDRDRYPLVDFHKPQ